MKAIISFFTVIALAWPISADATVFTYTAREVSGFSADVDVTFVAPIPAVVPDNIKTELAKKYGVSVSSIGNTAFAPLVGYYSGNWRNASTGKSGAFRSVGITYDNKPILLFEWGGACPGTQYATASGNSSGSAIFLDLVFGWDCVGHLAGGSVTMDLTGQK